MEIQRLHEFKVVRRPLCAREDVAVYKIANPQAIAVLHRRMIGEQTHREHFIAYYLDVANRVIGAERVMVGTQHQVFVDPRDVFRGALLAGAHSIIVAHNHPTGDPAPSDADRDLTERLTAAGELIGVTLLDHVVVGDASHFSFARGGAT